MRFVVVNLFTGLRLPLAIMTYLLAADGRWELTAVLLYIGLITDLLDGPLARRLNVTSRFGSHLDAQCDRLLVLAPIFGMAAADDIPVSLAVTAAAGMYFADAVAAKFELMRVVWWPLCYLLICYGVFSHTGWLVWVAVGAAGFVAADIVIRLKPEEAAGMRRAAHL